MKKQGLHYKLIKAFLLQIMLISFATLLGVFTTEKIIEKVLVRQALVGEAAHFWARHRENPDFPKPETLNLKGYLAKGIISPAYLYPCKNWTPAIIVPILGDENRLFMSRTGAICACIWFLKNNRLPC